MTKEYNQVAMSSARLQRNSLRVKTDFRAGVVDPLAARFCNYEEELDNRLDMFKEAPLEYFELKLFELNQRLNTMHSETM